MTEDTEQLYIDLLQQYKDQFSKDTSYKFYNTTYPERPEQPTANINSVYVSESFFFDCTAQIRGGAIHYSTVHGKLLVEYSTFRNCSTTGDNWAGAIYAKECNCVIYCVCGSGCSAQNSAGQFIRTELNLDGNHLDFICLSSVSSTPLKSENNSYTICLVCGKQFCSTINVSRNKVNSCSGIWLNSGTDKPLITYCLLNSNEATSYYCIALVNAGHVTGYDIKFCNIINNVQPDTKYYGLISCLNPTTISNCYILGNQCSPLLSANNDQITLYNCTLPKTYETIGSVNTKEANSLSPFYNNIVFSKTKEFCPMPIYGEYPMTNIPRNEKIPKNYIFLTSKIIDEDDKQDRSVSNSSKSGPNVKYNETTPINNETHNIFVSVCNIIFKFITSPILFFTITYVSPK